jgi:hypothetical protein
MGSKERDGEESRGMEVEGVGRGTEEGRVREVERVGRGK